ncbi:MAG TPA: hypothetical protein VMI55_07925 [Thermoplasmata archaeon]|nr:hypothetical protein [Thermoplasmata archaeon]
MSPADSALVVRTRRAFPRPAGTVWPLLCNSKMDGSHRLLFRLGVPQPLECRLPDGEGVGHERECVSDQGVVHQRILTWAPETKLSFRMESNDLRWSRLVDGIEDTFDLQTTPTGVRVTRTTRVQVRPTASLFQRLGLRLGLKQVHRYVFRNWARLARLSDPNGRPTAMRSRGLSAATGSAKTR